MKSQKLTGNQEFIETEYTFDKDGITIKKNQLTVTPKNDDTQRKTTETLHKTLIDKKEEKPEVEFTVSIEKKEPKTLEIDFCKIDNFQINTKIEGSILVEIPFGERKTIHLNGNTIEGDIEINSVNIVKQGNSTTRYAGKEKGSGGVVMNGDISQLNYFTFLYSKYPEDTKFTINGHLYHLKDNKFVPFSEEETKKQKDEIDKSNFVELEIKGGTVKGNIQFKYTTGKIILTDCTHEGKIINDPK